jgi:hypothetical protein
MQLAGYCEQRHKAMQDLPCGVPCPLPRAARCRSPTKSHRWRQRRQTTAPHGSTAMPLPFVIDDSGGSIPHHWWQIPPHPLHASGGNGLGTVNQAVAPYAHGKPCLPWFVYFVNWNVVCYNSNTVFLSWTIDLLIWAVAAAVFTMICLLCELKYSLQ